MIGIYKITSPTGRIYIGQSIDIEYRIRKYKKIQNCKNQPKLYNSLLKHGSENHVFEVIQECIVYELKDLERYWQEYYKSVEFGLNCEYSNGKNTKKITSVSTRLKMSKSHKGISKTIDHRNKISMANKGKVKTKEHLKKLSESRLGRLTGEKHHNSKLVLNLETGIYYNSAKEASLSSNIKHSTMKSRLNGYCINNSPFVYA